MVFKTDLIIMKANIVCLDIFLQILVSPFNV